MYEINGTSLYREDKDLSRNFEEWVSYLPESVGYGKISKAKTEYCLPASPWTSAQLCSYMVCPAGSQGKRQTGLRTLVLWAAINEAKCKPAISAVEAAIWGQLSYAIWTSFIGSCNWEGQAGGLGYFSSVPGIHEHAAGEWRGGVGRDSAFWTPLILRSPYTNLHQEHHS